MNVQLNLTLLLIFALCSPLIAKGAQVSKHQENNTTPVENQATGLKGSAIHPTSRRIIYIPPSLGKPVPLHHERIPPGASRGNKPAIGLVLITPVDHVAQTTNPQPTLYWYISEATELPIMFTLQEDEAVYPLIEARLTTTSQGYQSISLGDYNKELKIGKVYRWSIDIMQDKEQTEVKSGDILDEAFIKRIPAVNDQAHKPLTDQIDQAQTFAARGLWYDAIALLMEQQAGTDPKRLAEARRDLLQQVELVNLD